jgi:hypothetical protein
MMMIRKKKRRSYCDCKKKRKLNWKPLIHFWPYGHYFAYLLSKKEGRTVLRQDIRAMAECSYCGFIHYDIIRRRRRKGKGKNPLRGN